MTDQKSNKSRRRLLKSLAAGSGAVVAGKSLPESWARPVINSVLLPAHATTTDVTASSGPEITTTAAPEETTNTAPCNIDGNYCWIRRKDASNTVTTTFMVTSDGSISIHRENTKNRLTWDGSGSASNGSLGGDFDITAYNSGNGRDRRYVGTIVCNSDSIRTTEYNFKVGDAGTPFAAVKDGCVAG